MSRRKQELQVQIEMPADQCWFGGDHPCKIERPRKGALWHGLPADDDRNSPYALIECADGSVFTSHDVWGHW